VHQIVIAVKKGPKINRIRRILEKNLKNVELVEILPYEKDILEFIKEHDTAVLIMRITVEGLNGMGVTSEIRKFNERVQIILISDLEYFALLREAMHWKISEYLPEEYTQEQLLEAVEAAMSYYDRMNAEKYSLEKQGIVLNEALRFAENSFIYTALFSTSFEEEYKSYQKLLHLEDYGYILNIELNQRDKAMPGEQLLYHYLKNTIREYDEHCVIGPRIGDRILAFLSCGGEIEESQKQREREKENLLLSEHIIEELEKRFGIEVLIGIGGIKPLSLLHLSYEEAIQCLRYRGKKKVVQFHEVEPEELSKESYIKLEDQFLKSVRLGTADAIDSFNALLEAIRPLRMEIRRNKIFGFLIMADYEARNDSKTDLEYLSIERGLEEIKDMGAVALEQWAYSKLEYILNSTRSNRIVRKSEAVKMALRYMEENYMKQISLEEISQYVGISPQHFSKIFKEETGLNYIDWLTNLRIESAKQMLLTEKNTVKEVCYMVGYNDPNYFSRIFKKIEGVSPTEYISETLSSANSSS
jgi:two-component system response regulator YesN